MASEHKEWDDISLYKRAIREGWPLTPDQLALAVEKVVGALEVADNARDIGRLVDVMARLFGQNQAAAMADKYLDAMSPEGQTRIVSPSEMAKLMMATVPEESIIDVEVIPHKEQDDVSCPPLASSSPSREAFGHGVW